MKRRAAYLFVAALVLAVSPVFADKVKKRDTIKSLEGKSVAIRPGKVIARSTDLARDNYRAFLDLVSDDPELRAEAMRRLGDLELDATEAEQLAMNIDTLNHASFNNAVALYQQLPEAYPFVWPGKSHRTASAASGSRSIASRI